MEDNNETVSVSTKESDVNQPITIKQPSYNDLVNQTHELREQLRRLKEATRRAASEESSESTKSLSCTQNDYRVPSDVDHNISQFNGRETNYVADDWISSVAGI